MVAQLYLNLDLHLRGLKRCLRILNLHMNNLLLYDIDLSRQLLAPICHDLSYPVT